MNEFQRTEMLIGKYALEKLRASSVIVFGIGGVGGHIAEALARSGVGHIALVDNDAVNETNINRQIIALHSTVGRLKTDVMAERLHDINPDIKTECFTMFYDSITQHDIDLSSYSYIADAIDTVSSKLMLIENAVSADVPIISSMGTGNKLDPSRFKIVDISKTSVCPLAKVMRRELKRRGINHLKVLYSDEQPLTPVSENTPTDTPRRHIPASISFVPSAAGLMIAGEIIRDIIGISS